MGTPTTDLKLHDVEKIRFRQHRLPPGTSYPVIRAAITRSIRGDSHTVAIVLHCKST